MKKMGSFCFVAIAILDRCILLILGTYLIQRVDHMNLIINGKFNDLHGLLSSFLLFSNHDYFKTQIEEKWNISSDEEMGKHANKILENWIGYTR